jgi:hypothetical protein
MDIQDAENPPACGAGGSDSKAFPGRNCSKTTTPKAQVSQETTPHSPAVAAAIGRSNKRLLAIKRGSIASLAGMAGASLDCTMEAIDNVDDDAMLEHATRFFESARGFARLLADFRNEREASQ